MNDIWEQLRSGEVIPMPSPEESAVSCCNRVYIADGWTFEVFDDAGEADYIELATSSDGVVVEFDDLTPDDADLCHSWPWPNDQEYWGQPAEEWASLCWKPKGPPLPEPTMGEATARLVKVLEDVGILVRGALASAGVTDG